MLKTIIVPGLLIVFAILFLLASIGEREYRNKIIYAITGAVLLALLLVNINTV
jgi:hypothetical protein